MLISTQNSSLPKRKFQSEFAPAARKFTFTFPLNPKKIYPKLNNFIVFFPTQTKPHFFKKVMIMATTNDAYDANDFPLHSAQVQEVRMWSSVPYTPNYVDGRVEINV